MGIWHLDLASSTSVEQFVKKASALKTLDVVIWNVGAMLDMWKEAEGMEVNMLNSGEHDKVGRPLGVEINRKRDEAEWGRGGLCLWLVD